MLLLRNPEACFNRLCAGRQYQQMLARVLCDAVSALCSSLTDLLAGGGSSTACLLLQGSFLGCLM